MNAKLPPISGDALLAAVRRLGVGDMPSIPYPSNYFCDDPPMSLRAPAPCCSLGAAGFHHEHQVLTPDGWVTLPSPNDHEAETEQRK